MKGESNATAPNWFLCSRAEAQGDMCCLSLLPRLCSCCGQPARHSEQSHATHPGFAQTNVPAQAADNIQSTTLIMVGRKTSWNTICCGQPSQDPGRTKGPTTPSCHVQQMTQGESHVRFVPLSQFQLVIEFIFFLVGVVVWIQHENYIDNIPMFDAE